METHQKFLLFMITNARLSTCRCSTAELFNDMSSFDTTGVMEKKGWDEICNVGELSSASMYNVGRVELHIGVCNATSGYTAGRQQHARERRL